MPKRVVENIEIRADECFDDIKRAAVKLLPRSVQDEFEKKDRGISPYHGKFLRVRLCSRCSRKLTTYTYRLFLSLFSKIGFWSSKTSLITKFKNLFSLFLL